MFAAASRSSNIQSDKNETPRQRPAILVSPGLPALDFSPPKLAFYSRREDCFDKAEELEHRVTLEHYAGSGDSSMNAEAKINRVWHAIVGIPFRDGNRVVSDRDYLSPSNFRREQESESSHFFIRRPTREAFLCDLADNPETKPFLEIALQDIYFDLRTGHVKRAVEDFKSRQKLTEENSADGAEVSVDQAVNEIIRVAHLVSEYAGFSRLSTTFSKLGTGQSKS